MKTYYQHFDAPVNVFPHQEHHHPQAQTIPSQHSHQNSDKHTDPSYQIVTMMAQHPQPMDLTIRRFPIGDQDPGRTTGTLEIELADPRTLTRSTEDHDIQVPIPKRAIQ